MKVLLLEDVYNLGRAGEVKKVANGYGRNYLIPQGLAVLATPGALAQAQRIQEEADRKRKLMNKEMSAVAERLEEVRLMFAARAGETGKLYGSVTTQIIAESLTEELGTEINKRQVDSQPLRLLGMHKAKVRLTIDLIPEFDVVIYREGESPDAYLIDAEELAALTAEETDEGSPKPVPEVEPVVEVETTEVTPETENALEEQEPTEEVEE